MSKPIYLASDLTYTTEKASITISQTILDGLWNITCPVTIAQIPPAIAPYISASLVQALGYIASTGITSQITKLT